MRYRALDAWRGIAALGVVLFHAPFVGAVHTAAVVIDFGFVQLFFVLSGFVIAHAYGHRIAGPSDAARFIVRRFGRLYPLHIFTFGLMLALEVTKLAAMRVLHVGAGDPAFGPGAGWHSIATNVLLIHAVGFESEFTWNGPSWSISAELWTYLVFAAIALLAAPGGVPCWAGSRPRPPCSMRGW
jgi:peptidoglycan/LPS O-acetylase OafA/YrhL